MTLGAESDSLFSKRNLLIICGDIRFWIVIFFILRLYGIENPPLETGHNWRQSLTNMIARNFYTSGFDLLHPTIDMAGEKTGIIASEFPLLNAIIAFFFEIFGFEHWYGRLVNLVVSSFGILAFYSLIRAFFNPRTAFFSAFILLVSIWFTFSRKIMPDTFSVSLVLIGLWWGYRFLREERFNVFYLLGFLTFTVLGILCKIPALALMGSLVIIPFSAELKSSRICWFIVASVVVVSGVYFWYFQWVPHLLSVYKYQLYFPKSLTEGIDEIYPLWPELLKRFYFSALKSYVAFAICLGGFFLLIKNEGLRLKIGLSAIFLLFLVFILKTGSVFPLHNYYIIPFVPVMALAGGYFLGNINSKWSVSLMAIIAIEALANQQHDFIIKPERTYKLSLAEKIDQHLPPQGLIVINGGQSPTDIYFADRKGWTLKTQTCLNPSSLDSLSALGAEFLIIDRNYATEAPDLPLIFSDANYFFFRLE